MLPSPTLHGRIVAARPLDRTLPTTEYIVLSVEDYSVVLVDMGGGIVSGETRRVNTAGGYDSWEILASRADDNAIGNVISSMTNVLASNIEIEDGFRATMVRTRSDLVDLLELNYGTTVAARRAAEDAALSATRMAEDVALSQKFRQIEMDPSPKPAEPFTESAFSDPDSKVQFNITVDSSDPEVVARVIERIRNKLNS